MKRFIILAALLTVLGVLAAARPAAACPMCKEAVPASGDVNDPTLTPEDQDAFRQAKAYNNSIYLFVGMPYLLLGGVGFLVYRNFKKARQVPTDAPQS